METSVRFDPDLVRRYDVSGPRYTSYPTAVQFSPAFGASDYARAARASNDDPIPRPLSLYVHVPFCASPCFYCGCTKVITRDPTAGSRYLRRLAREVELQSALFDRDRVVDQIHLGGGTPTFLTAPELAVLVQTLGRCFALRDDESREFSIEIDPRTVQAEGLAALAELGFNRVSLGVQDFDPAVQAAVNRVQPVADTLALIAAARRLGFRSVAVDLIYGLPRQTPEGFARTLELVIEARPDRIACYSYAHLPQLFKPQRRIRASDLCPPEVKFELLGLTVERLTAAGYVYVGMDHFALPGDALAVALQAGTLHRNFQGYSTHAGLDLVGLGMSAIGQVGDAYAQNVKVLPAWEAALDDGQLPIWRGLRMSFDDRVRRDTIQALLCRGEVSFNEIERRHDVNFTRYFAAEIARLEPLVHDGLCEVGARAISVTPLGRLLVRAVAMVFDAHLAVAGGQVRQFSRVV